MIDDELAGRVRAWMSETGRGYKAAARHFGLEVEEVRGLGRATKTSSTPKGKRSKTSSTPAPVEPEVAPEVEPSLPAAPTRPAAGDVATLARWRARLGPVEYAADKLVQVEEALEQAIGKAANAAAIAALFARAADARRALDVALAERPETQAVRDPAAFASWLATALDEWTDAHLEAALRCYAARHRARIQLRTEDHVAELTVDGWSTVRA
jgi:hypothetical protein